MDLSKFYSFMKKLMLFLIFFLSLNSVFGEEVSVLEGNVVSFKTGVTDIRKLYLIWLYRGAIIAKINEGNINLYDTDDGIFEDRLQLDNQTGSLTINDIRTKHAGPYQQKIISNETLIKTFSLTVQNVFFAGVENRREGDSVTLNTGVTEIKKYNLMMWMFGPSNPDIHLAEIIINHNISYDFDERYRDRLYVDHQTGSLIIRDLKTTDTGVYQLQISNIKETIYKRYNVFVAVGKPGLPASYIGLICAFVLLLILVVLGVIYYRHKYSHLKDEMKTVSVMEGNSAMLKAGIAKIQDHHKIIWRFGAKGPIIAQIHKRINDVSYGDDERFKNKLLLDCETGDLTVSDIRIRISGDYHLEITKRTKITKSKSFKVVVREDTLKVTGGESVELQTGTKLQDDDKIQWRSEVNGKSNEISLNSDDEIFGNRLTLDHQTGSLTITNIKHSETGVYELQIKNKNTTSYKKFNVVVWYDTLKHTSGDSVTLQTELSELKEDHQILWTFGEKNTRIAEINRASVKTSVYDGHDERFRDRLTLNKQNGDLTIRNISKGHSDVYKLQINSSSKSKCKSFMLIVNEKLESAMEGESVMLPTDLTDMQSDDVMILWMFGPEESLIAKADKNNKMLYGGADERFKEKLQLDQTGSLKITGINTEHTGLYKLQIISNRETRYKKFRVSLQANRETGGTEDTIEMMSEGIPLLAIQTSQHQH